jgi:hypothetical protein
VASIGITGITEAIRYPGYIHESALAGEGNMYGWNGILAASISPYLPGTMTVPALVLSVLTLTCVAIAWSNSDASPASAARDWALIGFTAMLADGHFYLQDTMLLMPGVVGLIATARGIERSAVLACAVIGWLILGLGNQPSQSWHVNIFGWYAVLATAALVAGQVLAARAEQSEDRTGLPRAA